MTKAKITLIGQSGRINPDALDIHGDPHPDAGKACTVIAKNKGGNYQLQLVDEDKVVVLDMAYFSVGVAADAGWDAVLPVRSAAPAAAQADADAVTFEFEATNGGRIVDMQIVPLASIHIGKTNPRKLFDEEELEDLAESIKLQGVLQPLLVRPRWTGGWMQGDLDGFELVAGERRYRASKMAGLKTVPVLIRSLDDLQTLEVQIVENVKRVDLTPMEEAESYQLLQRDYGYSVDMIAERIGGSAKKATVYARLKLCALGTEAREMLRKGTLSPSTALLVARIPVPALQVEAAQKIADGFGGEPMSARRAADFVQRKYMLELGRAKFKIKDATLVPAAGSCKTCPKRTGANPVLYPDVKNADVCTDPVCYAAKVDAHLEREKSKVLDEGRQVIDGSAAKKLLPNHWSDLPSDRFVAAKAELYKFGVYGRDELSIEALLGDQAPAPIYIENQESKELVKAYPADAVKAALKAKGIRASKASGHMGRERDEEKKAKEETAWRHELALDTLDHLEDQFSPDESMLRWISTRAAWRLWWHMGNDLQRRVCKLMYWDQLDDVSYTERRDHEMARIEALPPARLARFSVACDIAHDVHCSTYSKRDDKDDLHQTARRFDVDIAAAKKRAKTAPKGKTAKKAVDAEANNHTLPGLAEAA